MNFTNEELEQIKENDSTVETVINQIEAFKKGFPFTNLAKPCSLGKEIKKLEEKDFSEIISYHDKAQSEGRITKFVPASGAASRMFKSLLFFFNNYDQFSHMNLDDLAIGNDDIKETLLFFNKIKSFAFFNSLNEMVTKYGLDIEDLIAKKDIKTLVDYVLNEKALNYSNLPKSLIEFHKYNDTSRTSFEEHLVESELYVKDNNSNAKIHFTVSEEHLDLVKELFEKIKTNYSTNFEISFSLQKKSTDTIAVNIDNTPFKDKNGNLVFRPAGHGALIENLNDLLADVIFIKNIDNVVPDRLKETTVTYKKLISGYLLKTQAKIFSYLEQLENNQANLDEIINFMSDELMLEIETNLDKETKVKKIFSLLNRPIRVCGMVKNQGEPGGGPFVVKDTNNHLSLQIVETSQINLKDENQKDILAKSSHFNPVDLVCAVKNYKGNNFNLKDYIDYNTGFISNKSKDGKALKAMELPGLWNGAMAHWNTIFVEVPLITFNPVKTVNDLLRAEHSN
ncbi:MAG: DUF4301 family protein [Candidatus Sericytochromatia bacterium]